MIYELNELQLLSLMEKSAEAGANKVLTELGLKKSQLSQREAFRKFGESNVRRWKREGKVNPHKKGGIIYYLVSELEAMQNINELYEKHFNHERERQNTN